MIRKGKPPKTIELLHEGVACTLSFGRVQKGVWAVLLEDEPWAVGRRLKQGHWTVSRKRARQHGITLEKAAIALFYSEVG